MLDADMKTQIELALLVAMEDAGSLEELSLRKDDLLRLVEDCAQETSDELFDGQVP